MKPIANRIKVQLHNQESNPIKEINSLVSFIDYGNKITHVILYEYNIYLHILDIYIFIYLDLYRLRYIYTSIFIYSYIEPVLWRSG